MRNLREKKEENVNVADDRLKSVKIKGLKGKKLQPYTGIEDLPEAVYKDGKFIKSGEPRYFANGNLSVGYKIIEVKKGRGNIVHRSKILNLRPHKREKAFDKQIIKQLKDAGIPGII